MVGSLMVVVVTYVLVVLTANFVPSTPITACMSGVVSEHSQFACPCPLSKLEGEAEASMASIHITVPGHSVSKIFFANPAIFDARFPCLLPF